MIKCCCCLKSGSNHPEMWVHSNIKHNVTWERFKQLYPNYKGIKYIKRPFVKRRLRGLDNIYYEFPDSEFRVKPDRGNKYYISPIIALGGCAIYIIYKLINYKRMS